MQVNDGFPRARLTGRALRDTLDEFDLVAFRRIDESNLAAVN